MKDKAVSLKTIAYELSLSINTVSRALRDCDDISEETKKKVRATAIELGYLQNSVSQLIKKDNKILVGLVVSGFKNLFFSTLCDEIITLQRKNNNFDFTIVYTPNNHLDNECIKNCISQRVDVVLSFFDISENAEELAKLNNIFIILVGRKHRSNYISQNYTNDYYGGQLAAKYFLENHPNGDYIFVDCNSIEIATLRKNGFLDTIRKFSPKSKAITIDQEDIDKIPEYAKQGYSNIFFFNDYQAYLFIELIKAKFDNWSDQLSKYHFVGYDCLSKKIKGLIDINSIEYDYSLWAQKIIDSLLYYLNGNTRPVEFMIDVNFHQRQSKEEQL